jgi:[ribosomal protein S5]-alanine N-acetyltransferase
MRTLQTAKLTLVPQRVEHADQMFAVLSDPAIYEYENSPPASLAWLRARYARLESRQSHDGRQQWLNWVVRLGPDRLIGYVQATVRTEGSALIAYEFASSIWGQGLAHEAVAAMIVELVEHNHVHELWAVLKRANDRSMRLLERLHFSMSTPEQHDALQVEADEALMRRSVESTASH